MVTDRWDQIVSDHNNFILLHLKNLHSVVNLEY
jgi:hypothetical protein